MSPIDTKTTPGPAPNGLGQGLFATADIPCGGDVLNIQAPFVAVLETQRLQDTCSGCFGRRQLRNESHGQGQSDLRACLGCGVARYCDKTCQSKDWKTAHSLECSIFKALAPRILPINARAVLRMLLRSKRQKYAPDEMDRFLNLETHIKDIRVQNPAQWERLALSSKAVKAYSGVEVKEEVLVGLGAKLDLNAFNLVTPLYDRIGLYLHPYAALMNHSCAYNAIVGFDGDELFVKAVRPIRENEQIFISYVDATNPAPMRRKELRERYFFDCRCQKCEDESGTQVPEQLTPVESEAYSLLDGVSSLEPLNAIKEIRSVMGRLFSSHHDTTATDIDIDIDTVISAQPAISLLDELIASLLAVGNFPSAFLHAAIRYSRVDPAVYPSSHPLRQVHAFALARIGVHLSQGYEVEKTRVDNVDDVELEKFELDFGLLVFDILRRMVKLQTDGESCTVPSFRGMVGALFDEVKGEFDRMGFDARGLGGRVRGEWEKVGKAVDLVLERTYHARLLGS